MQQYTINNYELDFANKRIINNDTGEIIEDKDKIILMSNDFKKQLKEDDARQKALSEMVGIIEKKKTHRFNWKKDSHFIKIYRTELREYNQKVNLSPDEGLFLFNVQTYIEYETNRIAYPDGKNFTNKDLQNLTGLGRDKTEKVIKSLEQKHYIKRKGKRRAREIYFNPFLICSGNEVLKTTVDLFENYIPLTPY